MKIKQSGSTIVFKAVIYVLLTIMAIVCVFPFLIIVSGSFTDNYTILTQGYGILPKNFTVSAYKTIFKAPQDILQAYKMNFYYTIVGTGIGLFIITMTAYVISRPEFKYRNNVSFIIYFTSIFGGGMIPWYLMYTSVLGLKGSTFAIWFPALMSPFLVILMRTFIKESVPDAIAESAKIDGAGHVTIFLKIVMPVLGPGLATIGLFLAIGYWNDWYRSSMFSTSSKTWELQFYLYDLLNTTQALKQMAQNTSVSTADLPTESIKLAMAVVATGPVLLFYPFVQKYFVSGITVGAVKG
ncbi:putative aldouronate transport system permease protein [Anaerocolumna jejuensis DSM 15929]|uniref:Putative aldouronate transport system permease protein n=1 Tax=Anaerocolumna jejuensis DSM 15929 TaxID=1121322 RepID=A0A1M6TEF4_9FIRM|nr:carbohydrate ABC transporter permease [Anaerocolumna jejuensis]SHK55269.1 putative aldouronate transport system permease protein [Anaerocolumna jejuensis DSM 15929]